MSSLQQTIIDAITRARKTPTDRVKIFSDTTRTADDFANEMLFFIKPELTRPTDRGIALDPIVALVLKQLDAFGMHILDVDLLGARYLRDSGAMASHYGVINRLSNNALAALSQTAKDKFRETFGLSVEEAKPLGAFEYLRLMPLLNADTLDIVWQNMQLTKLAGGTYCGKVRCDGQEHYLINGFHPRQLDYYVQDGRSIVTFRVATNTDWATARNDFIGATNPAKATVGSLRRTLLENKENWNLDEVSQGLNGVHLSAGPVEGLAELCRFSGLAPDRDITSIKAFRLGRLLLAGAKPEVVREVLADGKITIGGKSTSVFEATEEKNTSDVAAILKSGGIDITSGASKAA